MDDKLYEMIRAKETTKILSFCRGDALFDVIARTRGVENNNVCHAAAKYGNGYFIEFLKQRIPDGTRDCINLTKKKTRDCIYDLLCEQNLKGEIPLHLAAQYGNKKIVETLLDILAIGDDDDRKKRNLFMIDKHGDTPLHRALRYGHQDIAILLLQTDAGLAYLPDNEAGESVAYLAAENLCERFLHTLLDSENNSQSSIRFSAPFGMTVFHPAKNLNDDIMLALIERRRELLKHQDNKGKTVLHYVVEDAIEPMVGVLLKADSSLALLHDNEGMTPLHRASTMGCFPIVRTILELSPNSISMICDKGDHAGQTPLHVAKMDAGFLRVCLQHTSMKELINVVDKEGNTPLHLALKQNSLAQDVANVLLEVSGVNWRLKNNEGYTPMDLCKNDLSTTLVVPKESVSDMKREALENIDVSTPLKLSKSKGNIPSNLKRLTSEYWRVKEEINLELPKMAYPYPWDFTSYRGVEGESVVHLAASEGDMRIINKSVEWSNKARVMVLSGENSKAETPLHVAAAAGKLQVVDAILKLSISTDKLGNKKPVQEEQLGVVIEASNADVINDDDNRPETSNAEWKPWKMKSAKGDTPLHCALRNGHEEVVMRLLERDPSLIYSSVNKMNESPLYLACLSGCHKTVKLILSKSIDDRDSDSEDTHGNSGLYHGKPISTDGPDGQNAEFFAIINETMKVFPKLGSDETLFREYTTESGEDIKRGESPRFFCKETR